MYSPQVSNTTFGNSILIIHGTTFPDTLSKLPPEITIYGSKAIVLSPELDAHPMYFEYFIWGENGILEFVYRLIYIYIYIYIQSIYE